MLSLSLPGRVFLCTLPTDMRKSFDSLAGLVEQQLDQDPLAGDLAEHGAGGQPRAAGIVVIEEAADQLAVAEALDRMGEAQFEQGAVESLDLGVDRLDQSSIRIRRKLRPIEGRHRRFTMQASDEKRDCRSFREGEIAGIDRLHLPCGESNINCYCSS